MILILVDQTTDRTRPEWTRGPATVMAEIVEKRGPGDQGTRGPETVMAEILILVDQGTRGPGDRQL